MQKKCIAVFVKVAKIAKFFLQPLSQIWEARSIATEGVWYSCHSTNGICSVCAYSALPGRGGVFHPTFYSASGCLGAAKSSNWRTNSMSGFFSVFPSLFLEVEMQYEIYVNASTLWVEMMGGVRVLMLVKMVHPHLLVKRPCLGPFCCYLKV